MSENRKTKHTTYWLTYELAYSSDFEDFYKWLVTQVTDVKECGLNTVYLKFHGDIESLKSSLKKHIKNIEECRIYVMYRKNEKMTGTFLFGSRKLQNPWDKYIISNKIEYDEE